MKKFLVLLFIFGLAISISVSAFAQSASVTIDGETSAIPLTFMPAYGFSIGSGYISTGMVSVSVYVIASGQGFVSYVLSAFTMNNSTSVEFTCDVTFNQPINSTNVVNADESGYVYGYGGSGVTITPTDAFLQVAKADGVNLGVDVGDSLSAGPGFTMYGPYNAVQAGPMQTLNTLNTQVGFTLTKTGLLGAAASFTGFVGIED